MAKVRNAVFLALYDLLLFLMSAKVIHYPNRWPDSLKDHLVTVSCTFGFVCFHDPVNPHEQSDGRRGQGYCPLPRLVFLFSGVRKREPVYHI